MKQRQFVMCVLACLLGPAVGVQAACKADAAAQSTGRFVVDGDVVHDQTTKLTWMRCSEGQERGADGGCQGTPRKFNCEQGNRARGEGWRVPTVEELESLVIKGCHGPVVNDQVFPGTPSAAYWTSSKVESNCWRVDFEYGGAYLTNWWDNYFIRLVRSSR